MHSGRTAGLQPTLHGPAAVRGGTREGNLAIEGLISYAAELGASRVVYHAANLPDEPASEDARLAETRSLAALATIAERLGVIIALENLAPVYPGPDALSFTPLSSGRWPSGSPRRPSGSASTSGSPSPELDPLRLDLHLPPGRGNVPWSRFAPLLARKSVAAMVLEVHPPRPAAAHLFEAAIETVAPPAVPALAQL